MSSTNRSISAALYIQLKFIFKICTMVLILLVFSLTESFGKKLKMKHYLHCFRIRTTCHNIFIPQTNFGRYFGTTCLRNDFNIRARTFVKLLTRSILWDLNKFRLNNVEREICLKCASLKCKWNLKVCIGTFYPSRILVPHSILSFPFSPPVFRKLSQPMIIIFSKYFPMFE